LKVLILEDPGLPGPMNMAVDACLVGMAERGEFDVALRTYTWVPHTVSLGRLQKGTGGMDGTKLRAHGFGLVRRPTGGRAVWHGRELTYSVTAGSRHPLYADGIDKSLGAVASVLVTALNAIGVPAVMNRAVRSGQGFGKGPCFVSHGRFEVMTPDGRKLVGSAQARTRGAFLEHGSILFDNDQPRLLDYTLAPEGPEETVETLRKRLSEATGTVREYSPGASPHDLVNPLQAAFMEYWGVHAVPADFEIIPAGELTRKTAEFST
jgi:lipoate-protein ligase A